MIYPAKRIPGPLRIDGDLDKPEWRKAPKTPRFLDVIGGTPAVYDTRAALLYDDQNLYVGFWCEEPYPHATMTERDDLLWFENDIEVFIAGRNSYYELELNVLNNLYEVFYIWQDAYASDPYFRAPRFDVLANGAKTFGGNHDRTGKYFWKGSHPRGNRWAYHNWDYPGLLHAVRVDGEVNRTDVPSRGYTFELAFPWAGMADLRDGETAAPKAGETLRILLARYELFHLNGQDVSAGWCVDPIGTDDNHYPEKFTEILITGESL